MLASGLDRSFMARYSDDREFLTHVLSCIRSILNEHSHVTLRLSQTTQRSGYAVFLQSTPFHLTLLLPKTLIKHLKSKSPYSLDAYLWQLIKQLPLNFDVKNPYVKLLNVYANNL
ncbi:MAG TPA: hypothetical protein VLK78_09505 [Candidatus Angelobacter sp.]|nr:hypothetical protein [Candidatus Angelobacter sp.]